jgi:hypothetical protein
VHGDCTIEAKKKYGMAAFVVASDDEGVCIVQDCVRRRVYLLSSAVCASFARFIMDRRPFVAQRSYYVNKGRKKEILVSRGPK